jgi:hypothetical protein
MKTDMKISDQVQSTVKEQVEAAREFIQADVAPDRIKADRYRNGEVDIGHEDGRSRVVATPVSDTIRAVKPALMRLFLQSDPVEFVPESAQSVQSAKQRTQMARYIFEREGGFMVLHDVFDDALVKKVGIAKVSWDEKEEIEFDEYTGLSMEAAYYISQQPEIEVESATQEPDGSVSMKVSRTTDKGRISIVALPPETFFVNAEAKSLETASVCGHAENQTVSDLVALGFDLEEVEGLDSDDLDIESDERFLTEEVESTDPLMKRVLVTEAYMDADIEGTGVPRKYKFILGGTSFKVLGYEPCDAVPFAIFEVDPIPHSFFGRSLAELLLQDQDAATSMQRGVIDSINMANTPRVVAVKGQVDVDSLMNNETGGIIWADRLDAVREFSMGNGATMALPAMQYHQQRLEAKTGVQGVGMGLDADALQNQSATSANIAERAAMGQTELIARTLAEGGMKQLFKLVDALVRQHPDQNKMMQVSGEFVEVDPRSWSADADVTVNVGLGTNRTEERAAAMGSMVQMQMNMFQTLGPDNPLVGLAEIRAGIADYYRMMGIYDVSSFVKPFGQREMQMMAQQQQQQPPQQQSNPLAEAEMIKAQSKEKTDAGKLMLEGQKAKMDDDFRRDEMAQDRVMEAVKLLGEYGIQVNQQQLAQEQAMPRY